MQCTKEKCDKEAKYIVDGYSLCDDHKHDQDDTDGEQEHQERTEGQKMAGV